MPRVIPYLFLSFSAPTSHDEWRGVAFFIQCRGWNIALWERMATTDGIQTGMLSPVNRCLLPSLRRATHSPLFYFSIRTGSYVAECFFFFQRKRKTVTHGFALSTHSLTLVSSTSKVEIITYLLI